MPHVPDSLYFLVEMQRKAEESAKKEAEAKEQAEAAKRSELEARLKAVEPRSFSSTACFLFGLSVLSVLIGTAAAVYKQGLTP